MKKTALVIVFSGVEEMEAIGPIDILRRGGVKVTIASLDKVLLVKGRSGIHIQAEVALTSVEEAPFDAIVLPGGPGIIQSVRPNRRIKDLLKQQHEAGGIVAAICAAPLIASDAGILTGKSFTAHTSVQGDLPDLNPNEAVIESENLITSRGAGTATAFSLAILAKLIDSATANTVAEAIHYRAAQ